MFDYEPTVENYLRMEKAKAYLSNEFDLGRIGKDFELSVRSAITPKSKIIDIQAGGKSDIRFTLKGKVIHAEIKSESGEVCKFEGDLVQKGKKELTLENLLQGQKRKFIIYSIDASLESARLVKTEDFFKILLDYQGRPNSMINWIDSKKKRAETGQGRLMVSVNPKNAQKRRNYLDQAIQGIGISLKELIELRNE